MTGFLDAMETFITLWVNRVIYVQVAVVISLLLFLIIQKLRTEHRVELKNARKIAMSQALCQEIFQGTAAGISLRSDLDYRAFSECCTEMILSFGGDYADKVRSFLLRYGAVDYYRKMSASPFWLRRYYAVEQLGMFAVDEVREFLLERLRIERSYPVKTRIIWALGRIADETVFETVTRFFSSSTSLSGKFEETIYATMIRAMVQRGFRDKLVECVRTTISREEVSVSVRKHLIEALGSTRFVEGTQGIMECAARHDRNIEMRLACIRAAGRILDPKLAQSDTVLTVDGLAQLVLDGLMDTDWRMRAVAATAATSCGVAVIPLLIPLLSDSTYTVRANSARALLELGPEGQLTLQGQLSSPDRFTRETVSFVLQSAMNAPSESATPGPA